MSNVAQIGSGVFSIKVYKVCSVLDVRLLFLSDFGLLKASASAICGGHRYQRRLVCRQEEFYVFCSW